MLNRLQQFFKSIPVRYYIVMGLTLLLSACGSAPTLPKRDDRYSDCWPCSVYTTTFEAVDKSMVKLVNIACENAILLLGICILFWLLFHVGKFIVSIQQPNIRKFVFPMTTVFFKAVIVAALIGGANESTGNYNIVDFMGQNIIQPVLDFFASISREILDSNALVKSSTQAESAVKLSDFKVAKDSIFGAAKSGGESVAGQFLDIVYRIYMALKMGVSLGFNIWRQGNAAGYIFSILIISMFWMLLLTLPMSFLDSIVRIVASVILSPFVLVGWVFPPTKWMLGRLWGILLGAGLNLMFSCFYIALTTYVVMTYAEKNYPGILGSAVQGKDPSLVEEVQSLSTTLIGFFILILCMNKLGGMISKLANQFGAESVDSSFIKAFQGLKKLSFAAGKTALAIAVASPTIAKEALDETKEVAKSIVKSGAQNGG